MIVEFLPWGFPLEWCISNSSKQYDGDRCIDDSVLLLRIGIAYAVLKDCHPSDVVASYQKEDLNINK